MEIYSSIFPAFPDTSGTAIIMKYYHEMPQVLRLFIRSFFSGSVVCDSEVKGIHLAHTIDADNKLLQKYNENFNDGINSLIAFFRIYSAEQEV
mgnify:CR=1 FL=1